MKVFTSMSSICHACCESLISASQVVNVLINSFNIFQLEIQNIYTEGQERIFNHYELIE